MNETNGHAWSHVEVATMNRKMVIKTDGRNAEDITNTPKVWSKKAGFLCELHVVLRLL